MKTIVDRLRGLAIDTAYLHQFFHTRRLHAVQAAKGVQQQLALANANPGNFLETLATSRLGACLAMPGNGKAMRFVTDLLDQ